MLSLSSKLFGRRVLHSLRYNSIKSIQTKSNKLEKTLQFNQNAGNNGFQQRLNKLESSLRRIGKITFNELNQCLNELSNSATVRPTTTQSLLLIRSCGALVSDESHERRRDLCQRMFETLSEVTNLDVSHYNQLLRVFIENNLEFDAINFLEKMQSKGIDPNRVTFILMIERFCQNGNVSEAIKILEHMKSKDMAISESVFNSLIFGYGKAGDLQTAEQTLEMMRSSGVEPSAETYTALLCAYALNAKNTEIKDKINKVFDEITKTEVQLSESDILKVYKTLALVDSESELLDQLFDKINKTSNYNKECLDVINDLLFANKVETALRLYDTMTASENQLSRGSVGNALIRSMIKTNVSPQTVIKVCEKLQSEGKNEFAIRNAVEYALHSANIDDCRTYLNRLSEEQPLRVHFFFPLIVKSENENQIINILSEDMSRFAGASYTQLVELFMDYIWPKNIVDVHSFMEKCKEIGFSFVVTYNSLIRYYITNDRIPEAIHLMNSPNYSSVNFVKRDIISDLADSVLKRNTSLTDITQVLKILNKSQRFSRTMETEMTDHFGQFLLNLIRRRVDESVLNRVFRAFEEKSIKLSEVSVNAICDRINLSEENEKLLNKLKTNTSDDLRGVAYHDIDDITKSRKDMTPDELEGHLIELKSKGLNTRGVLRNLLFAYCRRTRYSEDNNNDILVTESRNRVKQILAELKESNFEFSNAMYAMLMDFFVNCEDMDSALQMKSNIGKDFEIDFFKIFNMSALYVKRNEIQKAIDLIKEENSRKSDTIEGEEVNTPISRTRDLSIYRLLNSLIEANADSKLLKEVFDLCINYSAQTPTSVMAGPLIKYHVIKGDYSEALKEFENLVDTYRITPWKGHLMKYFLDSGDQISLQKVVDASNRTHGEMNTIWELASVCVESGKTRQAQKLLDTPGLRVRHEKVEHICDNMVKEEKLDSLEQFIRCTKSVFDVNRDRMLYHLIRGYIKAESPEKALNCWNLMQEEDIQPSDTTLILLANFLKKNNVTVPFDVPPEPIQTFKPKPKESQKDSANDPLHKFNDALKANDINEALRIKKSIESEGKSLLMSHNCSLIESLLNNGQIDEAYDITKSLLSSKTFPSPRILRYLYSKLSSAGSVRKLEELGSLSPDFMVQNNSFTNSLSFAYINSGRVEELINDKLVKMKPFPLGGFLQVLDVRPDLEERLLTIANELIKETDYHLPLNMVWISFMKKGRFEDADRIFESCPKLNDFLLFSSLLDSIRENKNIVLAQKLVETVSKSNLTPKSIGVTYSALIDAYLESGQITAAEDIVVNEVIKCKKTRTDPKTQTETKLIDIQHLNRSTLNRLYRAIREKEHREPKFQMVGNNNNNRAAADSSDDEFSSSSDEEVVDIKNK